MKCPKCHKSDEVVSHPEGPYCLDCGESLTSKLENDVALRSRSTVWFGDMITQIQLNGKAGLMNMETKEVCQLPENWKPIETEQYGIEDVIDLDTGGLATLSWRAVSEGDEIYVQHRHR